MATNIITLLGIIIASIIVTPFIVNAIRERNNKMPTDKQINIRAYLLLGLFFVLGLASGCLFAIEFIK